MLQGSKKGVFLLFLGGRHTLEVVFKSYVLIYAFKFY